VAEVLCPKSKADDTVLDCFAFFVAIGKPERAEPFLQRLEKSFFSSPAGETPRGMQPAYVEGRLAKLREILERHHCKDPRLVSAVSRMQRRLP